MRRKSKFLCLLLFIFFIGFRNVDPVGNRILRISETGNLTQAISTEIYQQFIFTHKVLTAAESIELETVNNIANRLVSAVKNYYHSRKADRELDGFVWETKLIKETREDAWCLPAGKIAVYSSLLPLTQSDASLAVVLSHEMAHLFLKHGDNRMKLYLKEFVGKKELAAALSAKPAETKELFKMAFGNGDYVGVIRGFNPVDEMEADKLGIVFCAMAGYNPEEAIVFWERMGHFQGTGRKPQLLSTHPMDEKRIPKLKELMEETVMNYYKPINKN